MARRGYHRHRLSQRVLPHIRDVPRLLSFAGALAGVGLAAAPAPTPALLLTVTLAAEGKSAEGEAVLARVKPRMEKFPLVGGSRLFADLAEGILALKQGEAANAEQRFRAALEFTEQQAGGKHGAAWASRWLASALQAEGRISAARAAADDAVRIWSQIYQDRSAPLLEARAYAAKLSRQLPGVPPVP